MKKILLIGASGTIGKAVHNELKDDCEVVLVGNSSGDFQVDLADSESIKALYQAVPNVDAVICAAARGVVFKPLAEMCRDDYVQSMQSKLLGQIDLVVQGMQYLHKQASFTLTTGILNADPIASGTAAATINSAVEGFVKAAAMDVDGRQRINVVSPGLLEESHEKLGHLFPGYPTVPGARVAKAYRKAVFGIRTGHVFKVAWEQ